MEPIELERPRDLGGILDDAFRVYRAHWLTLLACATVVVVPVQVLVFGVGLGWLSEHYVASSPIGDSLAGLVAQLLVVTPLVTAMTVHVVRHAARRESVRPGAAIAAGLEAFSALFLPIALVALGVLLGLFAFVIPGIVLAVRWAVVPQVIVVERVTGTAALRRSGELVAGHGWFTFLVVLLVNLLVGVIGVVATIPLDAVAKSADAQAYALVGQILGQLIALPLLAVAVTLLYFSLRVGQRLPPSQPPAEPAAPPDPQAAPDPEVDPFGRRRDEGWEPPVRDY